MEAAKTRDLYLQSKLARHFTADLAENTGLGGLHAGPASSRSAGSHGLENSTISMNSESPVRCTAIRTPKMSRAS